MPYCGDYRSRGWLAITDDNWNHQPPSVDLEEWPQYLFFKETNSKKAIARCRARNDSAAKDFAGNKDGANLSSCVIWKLSTTMIGKWNKMTGPSPASTPHLHYVGFTICRIDAATNQEFTFDEYEEVRQIVYKEVEEAGFPSVLDNWHAWQDNGAYYVDTPETCIMVYEHLQHHLPKVGINLYLGFPSEFFEEEGDPAINMRKYV